MESPPGPRPSPAPARRSVTTATSAARHGTAAAVHTIETATHGRYLVEPPVGSWMTRQDRELAIADNIAYVRAVVEAVRERYAAGDVLVYCGFSQGVAMAYRAAAGAGHPCRGVIALGGDVPPELRTDPGGAWPPVLIGRGRTDTWYTQDRLEADRACLADAGATVETLVFDGGHEWTAAFRAAAGRFLAALC